MMQHTDILNGWYASITEYLIASVQTTHNTGLCRVKITEVKAVYFNFRSVGISFDGWNYSITTIKKKSVIIIASYYCCCSSLFIIFRRMLIISGKQHQCFA